MEAARTDGPCTAPASRSSRLPSLVEIVLVNVEQDDEGLRREELEAAYPLRLIGRELLVADGRLAFEVPLYPFEQVILFIDNVSLRSLGSLETLVEALQSALQKFEVGEEELQHHVLNIAERVDRAVDVEHGIVIGTRARR